MDSQISNSVATPPSQPRAEENNQHPEYLCKQCETLEVKQWLAPRSVRYLYKLPDEFILEPPLAVSPSSSCALCRLLAHSLGQAKTVTKLTFENHSDTQTFEGHVTQSISMRVSGNGVQDVGLRVIPLGQSAFRLGSRRYSYARILEPEAANKKLMQEWLKMCENSHDRCKKLEAEIRRLPIRCSYLIDVKEMRVCDVSGEPRRYFALSYVRGQVEDLQLSKENVTELGERQALRRRFESLPRVIQDAITITQELGETFLWVDSLCICQNDLTNKHMQISKMNRIYQGAVATLVALHSKDAASGLLGVRPYDNPRTQHIERVHHIGMTTLLPDVHDRQSVYATRAWTYQEELFSRRLFYFDEHQVQFRCLKSAYSEDTYEGDPGFPYGRTGQLYGRYPYTDFAWWQKTVAEFSIRNYSFVEDRYKAFEGILNELTESSYPCVRGLPISDISAALCWEHKFRNTHEVSNRISPHPSWSWCGWTNGVGFSSRDVLPKIKIESLDDLPRLDQMQLNLTMKESPVTSRIPYTSKDANLPELSYFKSPSQPLILEFFAYSALIEAVVSSDGVRSHCHIYPLHSSIAAGSVPLPNIWKGLTQHHTATTVSIEAIMMGLSYTEFSAIDGTPSRVGVVHIMLIERKGEYCERLGVGTINESWFFSFYPVSRLIKLI